MSRWKKTQRRCLSLETINPGQQLEYDVFGRLVGNNPLSDAPARNIFQRIGDFFRGGKDNASPSDFGGYYSAGGSQSFSGGLK